MATTGVRLVPPLLQSPIDEGSGAHTRPWVEYHQEVADRLAKLSVGVSDGSNAAAGSVGEYLTASASGVGLTTATAANVVTLALTAGDWDVGGTVTFNPTGGTLTTGLIVSVSAASATPSGVQTQMSFSSPAGATHVLGAGSSLRMSSAGAATAYLVARAVFTASGMNASGTIWARRAR